MDWPNEQYVRLYVRDTATWLDLGWSGQLVLTLVMRKLDRAGVLDLGAHDPVDAVRLFCNLPEDVARDGLTRCLSHRVFEHNRALRRLVMPNYVEAQNCRSSDRVRQQMSRQRRRAESLPHEAAASPSVTSSRPASPRVTPSHPVSPDTTRGDIEHKLVNGARSVAVLTEAGARLSPQSGVQVTNVTSGHQTSTDVTPGHSSLTGNAERESSSGVRRAAPLIQSSSRTLPPQLSPAPATDHASGHISRRSEEPHLERFDELEEHPLDEAPFETADPAAPDRLAQLWLNRIVERVTTQPAARTGGKWTSHYTWIGQRPAAERERVGELIAAELAAGKLKPHMCTPAHVADEWTRYLHGRPPGRRNFEDEVSQLTPLEAASTEVKAAERAYQAATDPERRQELLGVWKAAIARKQEITSRASREAD